MLTLGVDFGSSETVIVRMSDSPDSPEPSVVVSEPNLVHLTEEGKRIMGQEVVHEGLVESASTARHLRHFIVRNSPLQVRSGDYAASFSQLGREYLLSLIQKAILAEKNEIDEVIFSIPAEAPASYLEWLDSIARETGIKNYSFSDEISAAASGYAVSTEKDLPVLLIAFGNETLEITIANLTSPVPGTFSGSNIIARTESDLGGQTIDRWIADAMLQRCFKWLQSSEKRDFYPRLLTACRKAKEELLVKESTELVVRRGVSAAISLSLTRDDLNSILIAHNLSRTIKSTIERAEVLALSKGIAPDRYCAVLMTGEGSLIPSVFSAVTARFGQELVHCDHPRTATAQGAAQKRVEPAGCLSLERDYALRYWDPETGDHEYRYIARRGTPCPSRGDVSRLLISAAYDGQTHLGIALYSFGTEQTLRRSPEIELVTDKTGRTRCVGLPKGERTARGDRDRVNETTPTILLAIPPARKGEARFELAFRIDPQGTLRLDARDLKTGKILLNDHFCAALT